MGIVFRQSVKNSMVVAMGALMGAAVIKLSTNYLSQPQYGFITNITNYAVVLSQILLLGLNSTLVVYIHKYANDTRKRKLLLTLCIVLPIFFLAAFTVFYFVFRSAILHHFQPDAAVYMAHFFIWLPIFILLFLYMTVLEQYLGSQMKVAVSAFMREVVLRGANIILIVLFAFNYISFNALLAGTILIYLIPVLIFLGIAMQIKGFGFSFKFGDFTKPEYKEIGYFSWYHFLYNISITLMFFMDQLSLAFYDHKGLSSVAVYRVAVFLISFLQLPLKALLPASFTVFAKAFAENDMGKAKDIFARSSINILIPTTAVALLLICNIENAVSVIKNGYSGITPVFLILLVGAFLNIATGMNDQVISVAKYYKFNFYLSTVFMLFLFILIRILVPHYSIYGAAWSTTIVVILFNVTKFLFIRKKLGMSPFSDKTILVIIAALPALAAGYFFPYFFSQARHVYVHTFIDAAIRTTIIIIIYLLMLLWLKPSKDLEEYIASIKKNKRLF